MFKKLPTRFSLLIWTLITSSVIHPLLNGWSFRWCGPQGSGLYYGYYDHNGRLHCNNPSNVECLEACKQDRVPCVALNPGERESCTDNENAKGPYVVTLQNLDKTISKKLSINAHDNVYITPCANPSDGFAFYTAQCDVESNNCSSSCFANAQKAPYGSYHYCRS